MFIERVGAVYFVSKIIVPKFCTSVCEQSLNAVCTVNLLLPFQ